MSESEAITLRSPKEIEKIREAAKIVVLTLKELKKAAQPGITTQELDDLAAKIFREHDAVSGSLNYYGYPGNICVSINEQVVHGIRGSRQLNEGDIVKFDVAASHKGYFADSTMTYPVGQVRPEVARLLKVTEEALFKGIDKAIVGNRISDISHAIQRHVEKNGLSVVRAFVGHGVGRNMHEAPQVPHFGPPHQGPLLRPGMVLAIEPQVNMGSPEITVLDDHWTAVTKDGKWSAHFEHTVAITNNGPDVLTRWE
ncbi:MAG TPA: type I methionyl aminopeptidase [Chloroflexota bacterium]|nr:type I methionyl aminopeptidase [Chloroflexota bacterium]HEX2987293.1 type I methionyl aminopeptidase [Chloroflexota bacterium]